MTLFAALHVELLRIVGQIGSGVIERRGDAPAAGQALVELAEQNPGRGDQHRVGHRQDGGNAGGGEPSGHTCHWIALGIQRGCLTCGQDHQPDLGPVQVLGEVLGRDQMGEAIILLEDQKTDPYGLPSGRFAADLAFPLDFTLERLAEQVWFPLDVLFGHLPKNAMSVEVKDIDRRLGLVVESCDERIERGWPEEFPSHSTRRVLLQGIDHRLGIRPWIDESPIARATDDEQQVQVVFRLHSKRCAAFGGSGDFSPNTNMRLFPEQKAPLWVVQEFPRQCQDPRVLGTDREHSVSRRFISKIKVGLVGFCFSEHSVEERFPDFGQAGFDAVGFGIVRIGKRLSTVRFDVPFDIGPILVADRIDEGHLARIVALERDVNFGTAGKLDCEFRPVHVDSLPQ